MLIERLRKRLKHLVKGPGACKNFPVFKSHKLGYLVPLYFKALIIKINPLFVLKITLKQKPKKIKIVKL